MSLYQLTAQVDPTGEINRFLALLESEEPNLDRITDFLFVDGEGDSTTNGFLLTGINAGTTNAVGGSCVVEGGPSLGSGAAGVLTIRGGAAEGATGAGGALDLYGGAATGSGAGGDVNVDAGASGSGTAGKVVIAPTLATEVRIAGASGCKIGVLSKATSPVVQVAAIDQAAYTTASRTVAAITSHAISGVGGGTPSSSAAETMTQAGTAGSADFTPTANNIATLFTELALVKADLANVKQNLNAHIDDEQAYGWLPA